MVKFTIDGAYKSIYKHRHIFKDIKPTIFITTSFVGKKIQESEYCDWEEMRELKEMGWEIGNHTHTHKSFSTLKEEDIIKEIETSQEILKKELGVEPTYFAYPSSDFTLRDVEITHRYFEKSRSCTPYTLKTLPGVIKGVFIARETTPQKVLKWICEKPNITLVLHELEDEPVMFYAKGRFIKKRTTWKPEYLKKIINEL